MQNQKNITTITLITICIFFLTSCTFLLDSSEPKIPPECSGVIDATERYWQIYHEVREQPKKGLEFSKELNKIKIPSAMLEQQGRLIYLVEDEFGCWSVKDHYHCSVLERERKDFTKSMRYFWYIHLPRELTACEPYLETLYNENTP